MMRLLFLVFAMFLGCGSAGALASHPSLEARGEAFAAAMRGGEGALEAFARTHLLSTQANPELASTFAQRQRASLVELGAVDRHLVHVVHDKLVFVYLRHSHQGVWKNYQFRASPERQGRLQLVFLADAVEPLARPGSALDSRESREFLSELIKRLDASHPFSGIAAAVTGGREVFVQIQGLADAKQGQPIRRDSVFGMASGSKLFTAVAILQLAQRGRVDLEQPLSKYLPSFPNAAYARQTRLSQLLTHTGGAGNYWDAEYEAARSEITLNAQMLPHVLRHLDASKSGKFVYSNSGYVLLGLVVEAVSGLPFHEYIERHILRPAGMAHTGYPLLASVPANLARPYQPAWESGAIVPGGYQPVPVGGRGSAAGGAVTNLDDMLRFAKALTQGKLLDSRHLALLTRALVPTGVPDSFQALGAAVDRTRQVESWGHGGRAPGTHFDLRIYPEQDTILVVMSNLDTLAGSELTSALDHLVRNSGAAGAQ